MKLKSYGRSWIDRVRFVRRGLWSSNPDIRIAAAINARAVMDRALVPVLIDALGDKKSLGVRQAAAETLSRIDQQALADYDPKAGGRALRQSAATVRERFRRLDFEKIIPRPLPLTLSTP